MSEWIYNIFLLYEGETCSKLGYVIHSTELDDAAAVKFLQGRVEDDLKTATEFPLRARFTADQYIAWCRLGRGHHLFEDLFKHVGANDNPLFVSTPVAGGRPIHQLEHEHDIPLNMSDVRSALGEDGQMIDWLAKYSSVNGIDIPQLIHDDYFLAIKLTFNAGLHVSALKLLLSCIDSIAYIEFGDEQQGRVPFIDWLTSYADLKVLEITAAELWELRNGVLHMTNLSSRRVRANKVRRISARTGGPADYPKQGRDGIFYFDLHELILAFSKATQLWIQTYNDTPEKFAEFVRRYDETISDSRVNFVSPSKIP